MPALALGLASPAAAAAPSPSRALLPRSFLRLRDSDMVVCDVGPQSIPREPAKTKQAHRDVCEVRAVVVFHSSPLAACCGFDLCHKYIFVFVFCICIPPAHASTHAQRTHSHSHPPHAYRFTKHAVVSLYTPLTRAQLSAVRRELLTCYPALDAPMITELLPSGTCEVSGGEYGTKFLVVDRMPLWFRAGQDAAYLPTLRMLHGCVCRMLHGMCVCACLFCVPVFVFCACLMCMCMCACLYVHPCVYVLVHACVCVALCACALVFCAVTLFVCAFVRANLNG